MAGDTSIIPNPGGALVSGNVPGQLLSMPIAPSAGSIALTGVAPSISKPTVTSMVPTVGGITLAGLAPTLAIGLNPTQISADGPFAVTLQWPALANSGIGGPAVFTATLPGWKSASFEATGTFGAGGSVQIEGSNDGVNFFKLSPAALTAAGVFATGTMEMPKYFRPHVTAGDGTTSIVVTAYLRAGP